MARIVSLVVLVAILLVMAGLFFQVMANFLLPLFRVLLVVMFGPLTVGFNPGAAGECESRPRISTGSILLMVLIPLLVLLVEAGHEAETVYRAALSSPADGNPPTSSRQPRTDRPPTSPGGRLGRGWLVDFGKSLGIDLDRNELKAGIGVGVRQFLAPLALRTTQFLGEDLGRPAGDGPRHVLLLRRRPGDGAGDPAAFALGRQPTAGIARPIRRA